MPLFYTLDLTVSGTPHNFSTNTSLSDLTIDSHYSTKSAHASRPPAAKSGPKANSSSNKSSSVQSLSRQPSLLPKRLTVSSSPQATNYSSRLPQASSSPLHRGTPSKSSQFGKGAQSYHNTPAKVVGGGSLHQTVTSDHDEIKSYGVEGNFSRFKYIFSFKLLFLPTICFASTLHHSLLSEHMKKAFIQLKIFPMTFWQVFL